MRSVWNPGLFHQSVTPYIISHLFNSSHAKSFWTQNACLSIKDSELKILNCQNEKKTVSECMSEFQKHGHVALQLTTQPFLVRVSHFNQWEFVALFLDCYSLIVTDLISPFLCHFINVPFIYYFYINVSPAACAIWQHPCMVKAVDGWSVNLVCLPW